MPDFSVESLASISKEELIILVIDEVAVSEPVRAILADLLQTSLIDEGDTLLDGIMKGCDRNPTLDDQFVELVVIPIGQVFTFSEDVHRAISFVHQ